MKQKAGLTLIELLLAISLIIIIVLTAGAGSVFILRQASLNTQRQKMFMQVDYAMEDIRLHSISASDVITPLVYDSGSPIFTIRGQSDIYNITADKIDDDVCYTYMVDSGKDLVRCTASLPPCTNACDNASSSREVLVSKDLSPQIKFSCNSGDEPNLVNVAITIPKAQNNWLSRDYEKTESIGLWFVDAVKP